MEVHVHRRWLLHDCVSDWNDVYSSTCHMQFSHWCIVYLLVALSPFPTSESTWCSVHKINTMFTSCITAQKSEGMISEHSFIKIKKIQINVKWNVSLLIDRWYEIMEKCSILR